MLLVARPTTAQLADAPWPKFGGDLQNTGQSAYGGAETSWQAISTGRAQTAPAIAEDGTVYVQVTGDYLSDDGGVLALEPTSGDVIGLMSIGYSTASPTMGSDGTVYTGSKEGTLYALDPALQAVDSSMTVSGAVQGLALGTGGTLYVTFGSNRLAAFNPETGAEQWSVVLTEYPVARVTAPVVGLEGRIFVGGAGEVAGSLYAFDADGSTLWAEHFEDGLVRAAPAVASDGTVHVVVSGGGARMLALNPADGAQRWAYQVGERLDHAPAIAADGTVYLASGGGLFSVAPVRIDRDASLYIGKPAEVNLALPQDFQPETHNFYYRLTGTRTYQDLDLQSNEDGTVFSGTIPGENVTLRGIDFYAAFSDARRTVTYPQVDPESDPAQLPVQFEEFTPRGDFEPDTYRMISVPAALEEANLADVFSDYGAYDPQRWRVLRWNPQTESYDELPALGDVPATPGRAFWLATREGESFTLGPGRSTDASTPVEITLTPGWNQVGNPYAFPVSVAALDLPGAVEGPVGFEGGAYRYEVERLAPWAGYFLYNGSSEPITIAVPPVEASTEKSDAEAVTAKATSPGRADDGYTMRLTAQLAGGTLRDRENVIGLASGADAGRDRMDYAEAPPVGDHVRLSILEGRERLAGSFKPPRGEGQWWDVEVTASVAEALPTRKRVQVHLSERGARPDGYRRYVIDRDAGTAIAVEDNAFSVELSRQRPVRRLRVILGTPDFAAANAEGAALDTHVDALRPNYPNPFSRETTIPYELRTPRRVVVEIYNMLGQRVRTLVDARREAGAHEVQWDGRNAQGRPVASGIYFCRITAGSYKATRKLVLIR